MSLINLLILLEFINHNAVKFYFGSKEILIKEKFNLIDEIRS